MEGSKTGLHDTSFAVQIVSGYAALVGSSFSTATSTQITNQTLNTARRDTIKNYDPAVHGRGEASVLLEFHPLSQELLLSGQEIGFVV